MRPNVILIFADDLGYGDLACYGSTVNRTPRLDRMAAEGIKFTDFYMGAALCSPSRAALMTGCYPKRVGLATGVGFPVLLPGDAIGLHSDEVTIADLLREQGYATYMVGKWHLGDQPPFFPMEHGFDSHYGLPYSNDMHPEHPRNDYFDFPPLPFMEGSEIVEIDPDQRTITDRYMLRTLDILRQHCSERREQPFFLYLAHMYVHLPLYPPQAYLERSLNGPYGAEVEHLDFTTGVLLDALRELGIEEDTLVIFTSDNGACGRDGSSNAPLRGFKGQTWEGGLRMPCLMRWPGHIPGGTVCREVASAMDLLPTLAHLCNAEVPSDRVIDGQDISRLLLAEEGATSPHEVFYYYRENELEAVRSGPWKLHVKRRELYNLDLDVSESNDVFQAHPEVVHRLDTLADECRRDLGDAARGIEGANCRPVGQVENPTTLTHLDARNPLVTAEYD